MQLNSETAEVLLKIAANCRINYRKPVDAHQFQCNRQSTRRTFTVVVLNANDNNRASNFRVNLPSNRNTVNSDTPSANLCCAHAITSNRSNSSVHTPPRSPTHHRHQTARGNRTPHPVSSDRSIHAAFT